MTNLFVVRILCIWRRYSLFDAVYCNLKPIFYFLLPTWFCNIEEGLVLHDFFLNDFEFTR